MITKLPEFIDDGLDTLAEDRDRQVSLHEGAELGVQRVGAGIAVILEELAEGGPELGGGGFVVGDEVEELGGDVCVDPLDDAEIVGDPPWVGRLGNGARLNVVV